MIGFWNVLDMSIQQLAAGLMILALLIALTWYVSRPVRRRRSLAPANPNPGGKERFLDAA